MRGKIRNPGPFLRLASIALQCSLNLFPNSCHAISAPAGTIENPQICGVYALYSYLRCMGHEVEYATVSDSLTPSDRGNSLVEIRDAARRLGVHLEIRKTSPDDIATMRQGPFIAHMRKDRIREGRPAEPAYDGHYVVVLPAESWRRPNEVDVVDGTYGCVDAYSFSGFPRLWTGYYLTEKGSWADSKWIDIGLLFVVLALTWRIYRIHHKTDLRSASYRASMPAS
jgi:hypothetical protein